MCPEQESFTIDPGLEALLARLDTISRHPMFQAQRDRAIGLVLRPYTDDSGQLRWMPLTEEMDLAVLYLFTDYFPDDGQLSLIEQVRDTIDAHVSEEERAWLDPLKHSSMDLLKIVDINPSWKTNWCCDRWGISRRSGYRLARWEGRCGLGRYC